jgi:hypothetical protein
VTSISAPQRAVHEALAALGLDARLEEPLRVGEGDASLLLKPDITLPASAPGGRPITIEYDGMYHFMLQLDARGESFSVAGVGVPAPHAARIRDGATILRDRLRALHRLPLLVVPHYEWTPLRTRKERAVYLLDRLTPLDAALAAAGERALASGPPEPEVDERAAAMERSSWRAPPPGVDGALAAAAVAPSALQTLAEPALPRFEPQWRRPKPGAGGGFAGGFGSSGGSRRPGA